MGSVPPLLSFLLMAVSGWVHRRQVIVIEILQAENRLLKERLRGKRIRFTDAERALLARKAKAVGPKALLKLDTIVSPDTLLRWHRRWVAQIRLPPMSPNLNVYAERFVRSIKEECLNRVVFVGQASLRRALTEYIKHYHAERNHQGLGNELIRKSAIACASDGCAKRRPRLEGMLKYYYHRAA